MNNYQKLSIIDRKNVNNYLIQVFGDEKIETNGKHMEDIYYYVDVLKTTNKYTCADIFTVAKNVNIVLNIYYWKYIKPPYNAHVTNLPDDVLAIIFDDDIIKFYGDKIYLSQFHSCVVLKP